MARNDETVTPDDSADVPTSPPIRTSPARVLCAVVRGTMPSSTVTATRTCVELACLATVDGPSAHT